MVSTHKKPHEENKVADKEYCPRALENGGGPDSTFKPPFNGEMTWRRWWCLQLLWKR